SNAAALASPHAVTVKATDSDGASATAGFTLVIDNVNDAPVQAGALAEQRATQGQTFTFDPSDYFDDPDGDPLGFTATGLPAGLEMDGAGVIRGRAEASAVQSEPHTVILTVTDAQGGSVQATLLIRVSSPPANDVVVRREEQNVNLRGDIVIQPTGVVDGGHIDGRVRNAGTIQGHVTLGLGARIVGGTITGELSGDSAFPATLDD